MATAAVSIALGAGVAAVAFYLAKLFLGREALGEVAAVTTPLSLGDDGRSVGEESGRAPSR